MGKKERSTKPEDPNQLMWEAEIKMRELAKTHFVEAMKIVRDQAEILSRMEGTFNLLEAETSMGVIESLPVIGFQLEPRIGYTDTFYIDPNGRIFESWREQDRPLQLRDINRSFITDKVTVAEKASSALRSACIKATSLPRP